MLDVGRPASTIARLDRDAFRRPQRVFDRSISPPPRGVRSRFVGRMFLSSVGSHQATPCRAYRRDRRRGSRVSAWAGPRPCRYARRQQAHERRSKTPGTTSRKACRNCSRRTGGVRHQHIGRSPTHGVFEKQGFLFQRRFRRLPPDDPPGGVDQRQAAIAFAAVGVHRSRLCPRPPACAARPRIRGWRPPRTA